MSIGYVHYLQLVHKCGTKLGTKLDKTSYVHIMSTIMSTGGRKNLRDKTWTKPRRNLDIDIDIDIDIILYKYNILRVMSQKVHNPWLRAKKKELGLGIGN